MKEQPVTVRGAFAFGLKAIAKAMYDHGQRYRMLSLKTKPFPRSQSADEHRRILDAIDEHIQV